jgi:hypothetical protein
MKRAQKQTGRKRTPKKGATPTKALATRVWLLIDGKVMEREGEDIREVELESITEGLLDARTGNRAVQIEIDDKRFRLKEDFPLLASEYTGSSLLTEIANNNLKLFEPIVKAQINVIKQAKKLDDNEVQKDEEVLALIEQRNAELRRLNAVMLDALLHRKKQASDCVQLEAEIRAAITDMDKITYESLYEKLNRHSADALRLEMQRCGLSIMFFKNANK